VSIVSQKSPTAEMRRCLVGRLPWRRWRHVGQVTIVGVAKATPTRMRGTWLWKDLQQEFTSESAYEDAHRSIDYTSFEIAIRHLSVRLSVLLRLHCPRFKAPHTSFYDCLVLRKTVARLPPLISDYIIIGLGLLHGQSVGLPTVNATKLIEIV